MVKFKLRHNSYKLLNMKLNTIMYTLVAIMLGCVLRVENISIVDLILCVILFEVMARMVFKFWRNLICGSNFRVGMLLSFKLTQFFCWTDLLDYFCKDDMINKEYILMVSFIYVFVVFCYSMYIMVLKNFSDYEDVAHLYIGVDDYTVTMKLDLNEYASEVKKERIN